jgi:hypothetical protein
MNRIDLLNEDFKRVQCARLGLMSLEESAYITSPGIRELSILESKEIIKFGVRAGTLPPSYLRLLESNDVISLRLHASPRTAEVGRRLDESFGIDLALGVGQMIPGVKTFAGIAGVAYYAYQAYENFSGGSIMGGVGNLFLTLLSAAAIEPLGATSFVGPIVAALGPLTKLGKAFETFLGFIIKGAFGPVINLLSKTPGLKTFVEWVAKKGMPALEQAGGWLSSKAARLSQWLAEKGAAKAAGEAAAKTAEGRLASVATYLSKKVGTAAETMSKFITNLKTFVTTGGKEAAGAAAGAEAKVAAAEAGALKFASAEEAKIASRAASKELNDLLAASAVSADDIALLSKNQVYRAQVGEAQAAAIEAAAARYQKARSAFDAFQGGGAATAAGAEGAVASGATAAAAPGAEAAAAAAAAQPAAQTAGALRGLGSAIATDVGRLHTFLDTQAGKLLSKAESMQVKRAVDSLRGAEAIVFKNKAGRELSRIYVDESGKIFRQFPGRAPTKATMSELLKTQRWKSALMNQGIPAARAQQIGRGITRGLSAGAGGVPDAEAAAGL